jgi:hypothetical protein
MGRIRGKEKGSGHARGSLVKDLGRPAELHTSGDVVVDPAEGVSERLLLGALEEVDSDL